MKNSRVSSLQEALDVVEALEPEDQLTLINLIRRRLAEQRRGEIAENADLLIHSIQDGKARYGSFEDLRDDLLGEP